MMKRIFLAVLLCAAWQDADKKSISSVFLLCAGILGGCLSLYAGREPVRTGLAVLVGAGLLLLAKVTAGAIGEGDGWFFIVAGLYLEFGETVFLLCSGVLFCAVYGLGLAVRAFVGGRRIRKKTLPFLPFLLPAGFWLAFF